MMLKLWYITGEGHKRKRGLKNTREKRQKNKLLKKELLTLIKLLRLSYLGYAEDSFCFSFSQYFFQTIHDRYLFSKIRLVFSPTLYKFIVWTC